MSLKGMDLGYGDEPQYIYIYICVCVCVYRDAARGKLPTLTTGGGGGAGPRRTGTDLIPPSLIQSYDIM
ncbi:hypothetical protein HanIR_Chr11g0559131 [Helianthus annuus]|nr:hypothetical protein HanIR_Chr11g0559131 [Helianthus annuus]